VHAGVGTTDRHTSLCDNAVMSHVSVGVGGEAIRQDDCDSGVTDRQTDAR
jgi:hypothetical protein